ncbi:MAG TPA: mannose-6-phosphate isomerase, class I [Acidobacteriaceae bacterium]|nr:mannose-6-phosphate isomerase, class I [Acidobacteriaceae bacterium]
MVEQGVRLSGALMLRGVVQHYDWGGYNFIPDLLGIENVTRRPYAELWIGAHAKAPSLVEEASGAEQPLDQLIAKAPEAILGPATSLKFGARLPYLFKVLDVHKMLSIQAHPTLVQAKEGFARENAAGVPLDAGNRNYKDDNHKPEIGVALTDFWMLHGFRPLEQIADALDRIPELGAVMPGFRQGLADAGHDHEARRAWLRELYSNVMTLAQEKVDSLLNQMIARLEEKPVSDKDNPDYWALRAAENFPLPGGHRDRGIFSIYLLNLVHMRPGQGTFQPAGVLHAYLEGVNVELMANSDNVLRGGLTTKHVDVPELLRILTFEGGRPEVLDGIQVTGQQRVYRTPAQEFELSRIALTAGGRYAGEAAYGPKALLVLQGYGQITAAGQRNALSRGSIAFLPAGTEFVMEAQGGDLVAFQAAVPLHARGAA